MLQDHMCLTTLFKTPVHPHGSHATYHHISVLISAQMDPSLDDLDCSCDDLDQRLLASWLSAYTTALSATTAVVLKVTTKQQGVHLIYVSLHITVRIACVSNHVLPIVLGK